MRGNFVWSGSSRSHEIAAADVQLFPGSCCLFGQALEPDRRLLEGQIAEELEHRLEDEREIVNNDGSSTFLTKEELEVMRPILEEQIRDELEEQDEEALDEAVALKMKELQEQKDYDEDVEGED